MQHEILYRDAFPIIRCRLSRGEQIKAEADAMIAMSPTVDIEGKREGSFLGGLVRSLVTSESFFFQYLTAARGDGEVLLGHPMPGAIESIDLDGSHGFIIQKGGFLAATASLELDTKTQGLAKGLFSGAGFFLLHAHGRGPLFIASYGAMHPIDLASGEEIVIDNGHLVAWQDNMDYDVQKSSSGWVSSLKSGEGVVCRFKGPGRLFIQTRNPNAFGSWLSTIIPSSN